MCDEFGRAALRRCCARVLQETGWERTDPTALEVLTDAGRDFILRVVRLAGDMAFLAGTSQLQLTHLLYSFHRLGVSLTDLEHYMKESQPGEAVCNVPQYPVRRSGSSQVQPREVSEYRDSSGEASPLLEPERGGAFSSSEETDRETALPRRRHRKCRSPERKKRRRHRKRAHRSGHKGRKHKRSATQAETSGIA